jgi:hypothetical protein
MNTCDTTKARPAGARVAQARTELWRALSGPCGFSLRHVLLDEFETAIREDEREGDAFEPPIPGAIA